MSMADEEDGGNRLGPGFETGFADIAGTRIRYAQRQGRGIPLLLCSGIGANFELAGPLLRALPELAVTLFDLPGTGGSPPACFVPTSGRYAKLAMGILDTVGYRGEFVVGGVSWGGALAQLIAHKAADRIRGLILMATSPGILMVPGRPSAIMRMVTPHRYLSGAYMRENAATIYGGEMRAHPGRARVFARMTSPPHPWSYLQQVVAMSTFTSLPWLRRVSCPALVLTGDEDPLVRPVNSRILAALLPNAELHVIRGGGHLFMVFQAETTAAMIRVFLATSAP